ncbi:hypothetical protein WR25_05888 [Diploscapter pachys]|uniref:Uncharacterized protein n=1 Tax=Diploscapter pachys TaxID=2018661 RepID=A0A2A2KFQ5_9BILA|nr:hypothetical protein WR25_05888 [Diploscapter pachys]
MLLHRRIVSIPGAQAQVRRAECCCGGFEREAGGQEAENAGRKRGKQEGERERLGLSTPILSDFPFPLSSFPAPFKSLIIPHSRLFIFMYLVTYQIVFELEDSDRAGNETEQSGDTMDMHIDGDFLKGLPLDSNYATMNLNGWEFVESNAIPSRQDFAALARDYGQPLVIRFYANGDDPNLLAQIGNLNLDSKIQEFDFEFALLKIRQWH